MLPHVASFIIAILSKPTDTVLDPFAGSGTVGVESAILGRKCILIDQNPFACILSQVKTSKVNSDFISRVLHKAKSTPLTQTNSRTDFFWKTQTWYNPTHYKDLCSLRNWLNLEKTNNPDRTVEFNFIDMMFLLTARSVSLADPAYSVPVRINKKKKRLSQAATRHLRKQNQGSVIQKFIAITNTGLQKKRQFEDNLTFPPSTTVINDNILTLQEDKIPMAADLIVTSPPYPGALKYIRASFPALEWLGLTKNTQELRQVQQASIGRERYHSWGGKYQSQTASKVVNNIRTNNETRAKLLHTYFVELYNSIQKMKSLTTPIGKIAIVVSPNTVSNQKVDTPKVIQEMAVHLGMTIEFEFVDKLRQSSQPTKRHSSAGKRIASEHVVVLSKEQP